jgi:outer membrane receptor for ferrienterochelin and colicins
MNRLIKCFTIPVLLLLWGAPSVFALDKFPTIYILDIKGNPILHAYVNLGEKGVMPVDSHGACQLPEDLEQEETLLIVAMGYDNMKVPVKEAIENPSIVLQEKIGSLGEVVISATRTNRSVEDLPMPVTVIGQDKIQETGAMRLSEVLREQTGLQVVANHGTGLQMQGLSSDYILILLDGEPLIGRTAGTLDLDRISVSNIDRIEILRGPSSSIYGSEAMAGVINIITKTNQSGITGSLQTRYRTHQTLDMGGDLGISDNGWDIYAYYNRFSTDGFDLNPEAPGLTSSAYLSNTFQAKIGKTFSDRWNAKAFIKYYNEDSDNFMEVSREGTASLADMFGKRKDLNINPTVTFKPSMDWTFTLRGMSSLFETESSTLYQEDGVLLESEDFRQFYHRTELQADHQLTPTQLVTAGAGHLVETVEATRYNDLNRFDAGYLFVQHQWNPSDRWNIVSGFRGDLHSQYGSQLSPKISGQYKINEKLSWQMSTGMGFKAPDFRQVLLNFNNASTGYFVYGASLVKEGMEKLQQQGQIQQILMDPSQFGDLKAETSWAFNTGFRYKISDDLLLHGNLFRNNISNLIETSPVARLTNGQHVYSYLNVANVVTQGAEIDLDWRILNGLRLSTGYMLLDTRDMDVLDRIDNGELYKRNASNRTQKVARSHYGGLLNRSRHSGHVKLNYYEKLTGVDMALRGIYRGRFGFGDVNGNLILDDDMEYAKALMVWNLTLSKTLDNGIRLEVGGNNLLNDLNPHDHTNAGRLLFVGLHSNLHQLFK